MNLIETAMQCETVAAEYSVSGSDLAGRRNGGWIHEGMCWGAAASEKNGSTTSKRKTVSPIT
ncbi:MAG: hypothetical protein WB341_11825 [Terracidiphilus sp.]